MGKTISSWFVALVLVGAPVLCRADSFSISTTLSTVGTFSCYEYAECIGGGSSITLPSGSGSATITFTGITSSTFDVTNSLTTVPLGRFDVTATEGFVFPVNTANPEQSIFRFNLRAFNPLFPSDYSALLWAFGPGGGTTLEQRGPWNFSVPLDSDPFPYTGVNFMTNSPLLTAGGATLVTADVGLVPEPSTMLLLGTGLLGAALRKRRKALRS